MFLPGLLFLQLALLPPTLSSPLLPFSPSSLLSPSSPLLSRDLTPPLLSRDLTPPLLSRDPSPYLLSRDPNPPLHPRGKLPVVWRDPSSATSIRLTYLGAMHGALANMGLQLLHNTYNDIMHRIMHEGDGMLPKGTFEADSAGWELYTVNTNNHQQTWGVLGGALFALANWMSSTGNVGAAHFIIYDGDNEVGQGTLASSRGNMGAD